MTLSLVNNSGDQVVTLHMPDASAAATVAAAAPIKGHIIRLVGVPYSNTSGTVNTLTLKVKGTAVTDATLNLSATGGTTSTLDMLATPPGDDTGRVNVGDSIQVASAGGSTGSTIANISVVIRDRF